MIGLIMAAMLLVDSAYPVCNAMVCPERTNDLVWENDKFGMRAYGPGEYHRWSGLDVFNKNTCSNVCIRWTRDVNYNHPGVTPNFHQNLGEGMDNYTMGASRGVGGVALFADGEWKTYPDWETSRIIHTGPDYCEFELVYPAFSAAGKMTYHITLKRGERFFRNDVSFERMPKDFVAGPGIDLDPGRDHKGSLFESAGVVSLFEDPKGRDGNEGSTMSAIFVRPGEKIETLTDHMNCRVLGFRGKAKFTYWAGASWSTAGEMISAEQWHEHVRQSVFSKTGGCGSASKTLKPVPVALTFDDGCEAHESIAAPLLEARGWRGTFNPITDSVSKGGRLITWAQLRNLVKRGHVVTSHSCSHPNLVKLLKEGNTNEVRRQIADSRDRIKREIGVEPEWFCSPFVAQNDTVIRIAAEEGMKVMTVRRVIFGRNYPPDKDYGKLIDLELAKHPKALDFLIHGITKKTGGFAPFEDEKDFCDFLDAIAEREKKGLIEVVPYVRAYTAWNAEGPAQ